LKGDDVMLFKRKSKLGKTNILMAFTFLVIPLILYTLFVIIPIVQAVRYSFYKWNGLGPMTNFVGLKNFIEVITHDVFHKALLNNFIIIALSLLLQLPTALLLALLVGRRLKGSVFFRSIFFLPYILSEVIAGVMWQFIYHPQFGIPNSFLAKIFPSLQTMALLGDPKTVLYAIFVVLWWKYFGLHMVLYIAGLQNIPDELEEAAYIDGANEFQLNWYVIIPLLKPTILISVFFSIIGSLQVFDLVWAMTKGDPVHSSETMVTYLYKFGFQRFNLGYGSAVAIVIFFICLIINYFYQKLLMREMK
jgi:raffinose/stachyose/melibiose transport system permease protein